MAVKKLFLIVLMNLLMLQTALADNVKKHFDHGDWDVLLKVHVAPIRGGQVTSVDYQGMKASRPQLKQYLQSLSSVGKYEFDQWSKDKQLTFLINAYNAWTVELVLTAWPNLESIKELGGFFSSPWNKEFIPFLEETRSLDDIEHGLIRGSGRYQDPRVHFALNCASIGCPALRAEAYRDDRLNQQLDDQTRLFLSDRNRNHQDADTLKLSSIFKWYREDFEKGWRGFNTLEDFQLAYSDALQLSPAMTQKLKSRNVDIDFLDYDWRLNARQ